MYSRIVDGETYTFGVSGKLIRNTLVMYDRQTDSLWSQLLGRAVEGPLAGKELEFVPAVHTTWADWKARHPDTIALVKGYSGGRDRYSGYYESGSAGVLGRRHQDDRLYVKEFVVGVALEGEDGLHAVAFPFSVLNQEPVVNAAVGPTPVLVIFDPQSGAAVVYRRALGDQTYMFHPRDGDTMVDAETGSVWDRWSGEAIAGPLAGETLARIKSTAAFWFGWKDWYPATAIYQGEES